VKPSRKSTLDSTKRRSAMRRIVISATVCGIVACLFLFLFPLAPLNAENTTEQIISHVDEILKENPLPSGQKAQLIKIAEDDTITFYVFRGTEGAEVKPHIHKTHDETIYVIKGTGQIFVNGKWVDLKPGSLHFNPMGESILFLVENLEVAPRLTPPA
jgi:quercetin dioxygenase-like cupin family protein